jgi:hypothetical protein
MKERFYSFNSYLRKIFGERVQRISINAGFNCPNRDGKLSVEGCIFCNNKSFSPFAEENTSVEEQIENSIKFYEKRLKVKKFIAYFQAFSSTYTEIEELERKYSVIKKFPQIVGLFISTRPDCVDEEKLKLISSYKKEYLVWIEYGLQTTNNKILKEINRNHTYEDFLNSLNLTRKYEINVGIHIILGLPLSTYEDIMQDAYKISRLDIQGVKFHILHVVKDTPLEELYQEGKVKLLKEDEYVNIICDFLERIPSSIVILRLVSDASSEYLVAPLWINQKSRVIEKIRKKLDERNTYQGYLYENNFSKGK